MALLGSLRVGLSVISEFCVLATGSSPYRFRGLWKLWLGRLATAVSFLSGIGFCRSLHFWRFVGFGFLAGCPVRFFAVRCRVWVACRHCQATGIGFCFGLVWLAGLHSVFYGWLGFLVCGWRFWWFRAGFSWVLSGLAGLVSFPLCGSAVRRVFPVRAKRHPHAQQASQRDCPPFRLAKSVFFTGKRLLYKQSRGQPLTVTLGGLSSGGLEFVG